jgi:ubiquinone/menaquinone biosynthesis C-methylase UbiE
MKKNMTSFEIENVKKVYDEIYPHFDVTRQSVWVDVKQFVDKFEKNSYVLDAGCGNGKNMYRDDCMFVGGDFCNNFLDMIKTKGHEGIQINVKALSFRNNTFDYTICIAVIHHIKEKSHQIHAINELIRVTRKHGKILISVWEAHGDYQNGDNFVKWNLQKKYNKKGTDKILNRYYYMYDINELYRDILRNIHNVTIEGYKSNYNNRFIILTKM